MFQYCSHLKCQSCGANNTFFYTQRYKIKSGEIRVGFTGLCRECKRDNWRLGMMKRYKKDRDLIIQRNMVWEKENIEYRKKYQMRRRFKKKMASDGGEYFNHRG